MICLDCSLEYEPRAGRGRQSPRCPDCQTIHRSLLSERRQLRFSLLTLNEWLEVSPFIAKIRREVNREQAGRCKTCGLERRLRLAVADDGAFIGLCAEDFGPWQKQQEMS